MMFFDPREPDHAGAIDSIAHDLYPNMLSDAEDIRDAIANTRFDEASEAAFTDLVNSSDDAVLLATAKHLQKSLREWLFECAQEKAKAEYENRPSHPIYREPDNG